MPATAQQQPQPQQQQNQMEMQMGQQEYSQLSQRGAIVQSSPYYPELQQVSQRVAAVADPQYFAPFHFMLINNSSPNAMAAPGGNVYVTTALMQFAQNQDELAAVLCHEVSHDIHHDVVNEQQKDQRLQGLNNLAGIFAPFGILGAAATGAVGLGAGAQSKSYSRQAESNADRAGAYTCAQAGFNPYGMVWLFDRMDAMPKQSSSGGMSSMEMFADHPTDGHRVADLESLFKSDPATFGRFDANESTAEMSHTSGARIKPVQGYAQDPGQQSARPQSAQQQQYGTPPSAQQPQQYGTPPNGQQPQQYGAPPQQYGAPPNAQQPQQYGAPPQQYGAPPNAQYPQQYGAPPQQYGAPPNAQYPQQYPQQYGAPIATQPPATPSP
ncbi:MAG TPA: M48 family metalloprotease [Candidatus Tumulicola sp.]